MKGTSLAKSRLLTAKTLSIAGKRRDCTVIVSRLSAPRVPWAGCCCCGPWPARSKYFSYVRRARVHLRGTQGEMAEDEVHLVRNISEPVTISLRREVAGQGHLRRQRAAVLWRGGCGSGPLSVLVPAAGGESGATVETAEQSWADLLQPVGA
jgi:hypothetical protein